ncbi:kinesin motor domain protein [Ceratobasidium sp. AG-Ba]|nr:kinesin motor domain protein [Ceratobasidium sp. AG-Ba]
MSLSATRSRRTNAGNRWAEALAAALVENGDASDPDAEISGDEFVGKEEEDVFESDFESTDEEEYTKEGIEDGEKQVIAEERAQRRAARARATKTAATPAQRMLERAIRGEPARKKQKVSAKTECDKSARKGTGDSVMWDATRQSRRTSTVKHKALVRERLKDAEQRKAHAVKRPRKAIVTKTQDELIAEALELEEKNVKSLQEFLVKEEEKRAAARRVVRMRIEGPKLRWISRAEDVRVRIEEVATTPAVGSNLLTAPVPTVPNNTSLPIINGPSHHPARSPLSQSVTLPLPDNNQARVQEHASQPDPTTTLKATQVATTTPSTSPLTPQNERASGTPAPSNSGRRMQVYVELPRRPVSGSQRPPSSTSPQPLPSISISEPSSQPASKEATPSQPLPAAQALVRAPSLASECELDELKPKSNGHVKPKEREATPKLLARNGDSTIFPPGGPNFAIVLPQRKPTTAPHKKERQMKNYIVVELSSKERASFGARMRAIFGDHADWTEMLLKGARPAGPRTKPVCAVTGLDAPYRDPRTGIPYANAYAYKTLTRLLQHEFVWSQEKGCYVGDEGKNAARGVPWNWSVAATGRT